MRHAANVLVALTVAVDLNGGGNSFENIAVLTITSPGALNRGDLYDAVIM